MKKVVYSSFVNLSANSGPAVNELEFLSGICELNDIELHVVQPDQEQRPELKNVKFTHFPSSKENVVLRALANFRVVLALRERQREFPKAKFIFRLDGFPLGFFLFSEIFRPEFILKTNGDGRFSLPTLRKIPRFALNVSKFMNKRLCRRAVSIDVVSQIHKDSLVSVTGVPAGRVNVIPNSVNLDRFAPGVKAKARKELGLERFSRLVGYVGGFPHLRGGRELITSLAAARQELNCELGGVIVGDGGGKQVLQALAKREGVEDFIIFTGQIPYAEVPQWIKSLDVGVSIISEEIAGASEQKVRQYLASGVFCLVSRGGSEFVEDERIGIVVRDPSREAVTAALIRALNSSSDETATRCRKFAEENLGHIRTARLRIDSLWPKE